MSRIKVRIFKTQETFIEYNREEFGQFSPVKDSLEEQNHLLPGQLEGEAELLTVPAGLQQVQAGQGRVRRLLQAGQQVPVHHTQGGQTGRYQVVLAVMCGRRQGGKEGSQLDHEGLHVGGVEASWRAGGEAGR
jgi:hypothetical protein